MYKKPRVSNVYIRIGSLGFEIKSAPDEEPYIRKAERPINDLVDEYKGLGYKDMNQILAMIAVDSMVERIKGEELIEQAQKTMLTRITKLRETIDEGLNA